MELPKLGEIWYRTGVDRSVTYDHIYVIIDCAFPKGDDICRLGNPVDITYVTEAGVQRSHAFLSQLKKAE